MTNAVHRIRTIAVDLTPVLPGGANGGAKVVALDLLRGLSAFAPATRFVILTRASAAAELAVLDAPNVRRIAVVADLATASPRSALLGFARRRLASFPRRLRVLAGRIGYALDKAHKRGAAQSLLREIDADLLFCPFTAPVFHTAGIPTVCVIHDLQFKTFPENFAPEDLVERSSTFANACRDATALVAVSDYSRASAIRHGALAPERIRTVHSRTARRLAARPSSVALFASLRIEPRRYLIYPANFWLHKNHEMLITAFGIACRRGLGEDVKLVCTGAPGPRMDWLFDAADRTGLGQRIVFPGFVSHDDLAVLVANAGAMIFPSLYEGFGLPVIESMAAGVAVGCSNAAALPEIAGDAALLFDPRLPEEIAAAVLALIGPAAATADMVEAGLRRAAAFGDTDRMVSEYWNAFEDAVGTSRTFGATASA